MADRDHVVVLREEAKVSGVEWEEYEFADLCDITRGASPRPIHDWISDQGIPWLKIADASATESRYIVQTRERIRSEGRTKSVPVVPGDLILSNSATPGVPKFVGIDACIHDGWLLLRNLRHLDKLFCYYLLLFERLRIVEQGSGTVFTNLKTDILKRHRVKVPPLPEQRAIAHVLGTLDDKIELNRRMNETLEEMARALFKSWFVDFESVRAKMEGRWHRGESLPGLPADLYDLFPDRLVDSELGEIPEGWEVKALGELCDKPQYGYTASAKEEPIGPKFLRITDINKLSWVDWVSVPHCEISELDRCKYQIRYGDILIARMADPGHGVMVEESREAVFASYLIRFRPVNELHARILQYWLNSDDYWELVYGRGAGTTRISLNAKVLSGFPLVIPPDSVAREYSCLIDSIRSIVVTNVAESTTLAAQRDALLPRLVSGEVQIDFGCCNRGEES